MTSPKDALNDLAKSNVQLKKRNKAAKDKAGEAIARRVDASLKAFNRLVAEESALEKKHTELVNLIRGHNMMLSSSMKDLQSLASDVQKLIKGEPSPRIYVTMYPLLGLVRGLPPMPDL